MGVCDNMLQKETSKVASGSHSEGRLGRVPTENGYFGPAPKYKPRKVSAVRDFPPGCGRFAPITRHVVSKSVNRSIFSQKFQLSYITFLISYSHDQNFQFQSKQAVQATNRSNLRTSNQYIKQY